MDNTEKVYNFMKSSKDKNGFIPTTSQIAKELNIPDHEAKSADEQLREIIFYIADDSGSVDIALNYLDKIEKAINTLEDFPMTGSVPRYSILRRQGYRVLIVERHLAFYKVNESEKTVTIYAIVDSRREYKNLI